MCLLKPNARFLRYTAVAVIAVSVIFVLLTRSHRWMKVRNATVFQNEVVIHESSVYRSATGELLVSLREEGELYLIVPSRHEVGIPSRSQFWFVPACAFTRSVNPPFVSLPSVKAEINPNLALTDNTIEFTSYGGVRIRISLN